MAVLKPHEIEQFIKSPDDGISAILLYGTNEGRIKNIATRIVKSIIGSLDDPFNLVFLNETQLKDTPGLLRDEALALSFTGGKKVIRVTDPGPAFTRQLSGFLDENTSTNLLLVETGNLTKTSAVRKAFEKSAHSLAIAFYDDNPRDLANLIAQQAGENQISIDSVATSFLIETVGINRSILLSELNKLFSYCALSKTITVQDIQAICNDPLNNSLDELVDFTLVGDLVHSIDRFQQLVSSGVDPVKILNVIGYHLHRLQTFRVNADKSGNLEQAIRSARPPVFFIRQPVVKRQVFLWQQKSLKRAISGVFEAIILTRQNAELSEKICERTIISLSKTAEIAAR
jgi:DNA polymerase-3 subunit delta